MSSPARRDELLYESDAALRLVDRAIQEMRVLDEQEPEVADAVVFAAGDVPADSHELTAAD
jgi:hypothetical protein